MKFAKLIIDRRINGCSPDGHPCHTTLPVDFRKVNVEIMQCSVLGETAGCSIIRIDDPDGTYESVLANHPTMTTLTGESTTMKIGKNRYISTVMNNNCMLAKIVSESGVFLTSAIPITDDIIEWTVLAPNPKYIFNMIERLNSLGYKVEKKTVSDFDEDVSLTVKQDEVLKYAYENGYYDIPKKLTVEDLCRKFDCSKSTLSVIMRGAEKKVIELYIGLNPYRMA